MQRLRWAPLVLLLLVSACGGGGSSPKAASGPPLSKAAFIAQADAICKRYEDNLSAQGKALSATSSQQQLSDFVVKQIVPSFRSMIGELRALNPPAADKAKITKMLDDLSTGLDQLESSAKTDVKSALNNEPQGFKDSDAAATAYGFTQCGSSSS
jgi:hypothetical protein